MSWTELERLVTTAEADGALRRALKPCRSQPELVLAARRLGYRITSHDLTEALMDHRRHRSNRPEDSASEPVSRIRLLTSGSHHCRGFRALLLAG